MPSQRPGLSTQPPPPRRAADVMWKQKVLGPRCSVRGSDRGPTPQAASPLCLSFLVESEMSPRNQRRWGGRLMFVPMTSGLTFPARPRKPHLPPSLHRDAGWDLPSAPGPCPGQSPQGLLFSGLRASGGSERITLWVATPSQGLPETTLRIRYLRHDSEQQQQQRHHSDEAAATRSCV